MKWTIIVLTKLVFACCEARGCMHKTGVIGSELEEDLFLSPKEIFRLEAYELVKFSTINHSGDYIG